MTMAVNINPFSSCNVSALVRYICMHSSLSLYRGSAISRIIGLNVQSSSKFDTLVRMWVFEEIVEGRKLSEVINEQHENIKYLPGVCLPENVVS